MTFSIEVLAVFFVQFIHLQHSKISQMQPGSVQYDEDLSILHLPLLVIILVIPRFMLSC